MKKMLICALFISLCAGLMAQEATTTQQQSQTTTTTASDFIDPYQLEELPDSIRYRYPLFNGLSVSTNIFPIALDLFGKDYRTYEAMLTVDLHHRFFPQVAVGMGSCDYTSDDDVRFKSSMAPFFKTGVVYNLKYNALKASDFYGIFLRYGCASSKADISGIHYNDGVWPEYGPTELTDLKYKCHWLEFGGMIKVQVFDHFSMGWDAYFKPMLKKGGNKHGKPYFVPGYGSTNTFIGFGFHLYYDIL
ncbi:MAG: DUF6048 family protein [Bacteroidales bacterium]|nr:DUF6048 family protein [Bacteroidales bacterium]